MDRCPGNAIYMVQDREGFYYPKIDKTVCVRCGKCEQVCPMKGQIQVKCDNLYLGVRVKDNIIRYSSSSGGFFGLLADYVIRKQGVVYGAGYGNHMKVIHQEAVALSQLEFLKRTKYVQSDMGGIYRKIEKNLVDDKWVLFCGTPCQAEALKSFLKRQFDKLIIADLVCYGVPSPGIWEDYVTYLERMHNGIMSEFFFRDKRNTDNGHMRSYIIGGEEYVDSLYDDFFCRMYFRNYTLRPSCHDCGFCTVNRNSDFTIGDFWKLEGCKPELDDGMGTSMVIAHTDKARKIWEDIREKTHWFECMKKDLLQPRLVSPTVPAKRRWWFMLLYKLLPFSITVKLMGR